MEYFQQNGILVQSQIHEVPLIMSSIKTSSRFWRHIHYEVSMFHGSGPYLSLYSSGQELNGKLTTHGKIYEIVSEGFSKWAEQNKITTSKWKSFSHIGNNHL